MNLYSCITVSIICGIKNTIEQLQAGYIVLLCYTSVMLQCYIAKWTNCYTIWTRLNTVHCVVRGLLHILISRVLAKDELSTYSITLSSQNYHAN
uniref:Uncharacterized protein n=1 Tax=Pararge aegeria TaxID=116150 RepID=S4PMT0_9NEOP